MGTVAHYLEVNAPADQCYAWWRGLTNLPQIMPDVQSVTPKDGSTHVTHWRVSGPLGKTVELVAALESHRRALRNRREQLGQPSRVRPRRVLAPARGA